MSSNDCSRGQTHTGVTLAPPTLTPLLLECTTEFNPVTQEICVNCTPSRNLASLDFECSLNGQLVTDGCELFDLGYRNV